MLRSHTKTAVIVCFIAAAVLLLPSPLRAELTNAGVLDDVLTKYKSAARGWSSVVQGAASRLFWALATISMVWTFAEKALRRADILEILAELVRFCFFTGFFWWLLQNGPAISDSLIVSMRQLGANAAGVKNALTPSSVIDVGFKIAFKMFDQSSLFSPWDSAIGILIGLVILVTLALVAVNMLVLLVTSWFLAYAGVFFLGFGGSRWTSDMAIGYFKTVLSIGTQLFAMVLLVGIGQTFLDSYYAQMSGDVKLKENAVMMIVAFCLLAVCNKVPALVSGLAFGASPNYSLGHGAGVGTAITVASAATAAVGAGAALIASGAANAGGLVQAIRAATGAARSELGGAGGATGGTSGGLATGRIGAGPLASALGEKSPPGTNARVAQQSSPASSSPQNRTGTSPADNTSRTSSATMAKGEAVGPSQALGGTQRNGGTSARGLPPEANGGGENGRPVTSSPHWPSNRKTSGGHSSSTSVEAPPAARNNETSIAPTQAGKSPSASAGEVVERAPADCEDSAAENSEGASGTAGVDVQQTAMSPGEASAHHDGSEGRTGGDAPSAATAMPEEQASTASSAAGGDSHNDTGPAPASTAGDAAARSGLSSGQETSQSAPQPAATSALTDRVPAGTTNVAQSRGGPAAASITPSSVRASPADPATGRDTIESRSDVASTSRQGTTAPVSVDAHTEPGAPTDDGGASTQASSQPSQATGAAAAASPRQDAPSPFRVAARATQILAHATASHMTSAALGAAKRRIDGTMGGRIAAAIRSQHEPPESAEIAAFRDSKASGESENTLSAADLPDLNNTGIALRDDD